MIPFIIAAAAAILSAGQKRREAARQNYIQELEQNAHEFGGNTRQANAFNNSAAVNAISADYGPALQLVGKFAEGAGGGDSDATSPAIDHAVDNPMHLSSPLLDYQEDDSQLPSWARRIRL